MKNSECFKEFLDTLVLEVMIGWPTLALVVGTVIIKGVGTNNHLVISVAKAVIAWLVFIVVTSYAISTTNLDGE